MKIGTEQIGYGYCQMKRDKHGQIIKTPHAKAKKCRRDPCWRSKSVSIMNEKKCFKFTGFFENKRKNVEKILS